MYVKKWFAFVSMIVAASLPAYGSSSTSTQGLLTSCPGDRPAAQLEGCVLFRNRLQDVSVDIAGSLMANWDSSRPTEIKDQERTATLPRAQ